MEWLNTLSGKIVGLDTAPLIYFIERHPVYLPIVRPFFSAVERGDIRMVTSTLTLTEVLVHPYRHGDRTLAQRYSQILLHAEHVTARPVSAEIAADAARLRALYSLRSPDAIQLATAQSAGATAFLTNDSRFQSIPGIDCILLNQFIP